MYVTFLGQQLDLFSFRLQVVQLDVTDEKQVHETYEYISQQVQETGLLVSFIVILNLNFKDLIILGL